MNFVIALNGRVITITNEPTADGYICGFDIAETDKTPEGKAAWKFMWERLHTMELQANDAPETRGKLRERPQQAILNELVEVPIGR